MAILAGCDNAFAYFAILNSFNEYSAVLVVPILIVKLRLIFLIAKNII
jgi:hypothetical protein